MFRLGRKEMLERVIRALDDDIPRVRAWAARMVERLGTDARAAVPALIRMERSGGRHLARAAFRALQSVRPRVSVAAVTLLDGIGGSSFLTFRKGMSWTYSIRGGGRSATGDHRPRPARRPAASGETAKRPFFGV